MRSFTKEFAGNRLRGGELTVSQHAGDLLLFETGRKRWRYYIHIQDEG
jgi:hypothetical protein